jgi:NAD(P)-dependent dehydrogenase (short-subunit alcohol dehydrogenase family)
MNNVWLDTGSASGLGRDIAEAVLESGDRLVATAREATSGLSLWGFSRVGDLGASMLGAGGWLGSDCGHARSRSQ